MEADVNAEATTAVGMPQQGLKTEVIQLPIPSKSRMAVAQGEIVVVGFVLINIQFHPFAGVVWRDGMDADHVLGAKCPEMAFDEIQRKTFVNGAVLDDRLGSGGGKGSEIMAAEVLVITTVAVISVHQIGENPLGKGRSVSTPGIPCGGQRTSIIYSIYCRHQIHHEPQRGCQFAVLGLLLVYGDRVGGFPFNPASSTVISTPKWSASCRMFAALKHLLLRKRNSSSGTRRLAMAYIIWCDFHTQYPRCLSGGINGLHRRPPFLVSMPQPLILLVATNTIFGMAVFW